MEVPKFDWVVSSIAHKCRDCKGIHFVPDDETESKAEKESISTYPETEQDSEIFETATEAFSGSDAPLVIDEGSIPDVHEEAFVTPTPMELVDEAENYPFTAPDIILVEEVITIKDEPEETDQVDQTIKNEDPLELGDEEVQERNQFHWYWK